ncbi:MAG: hypothetical protein JNM94_13010 [Phycisphaerae bacterium]|nr:hypothetical protein [Phycisphaerae bacterium]
MGRFGFRRGRKRRLLAWCCAVLAVATAALTVYSSRWYWRWAREFGPLSVSLSGADAQCSIWIATKTGVMGSYDVGWHASRAPAEADTPLVGKLLGGSWRWLMAPGGNEVLPPRHYAVWYVPGVIQYDHNDGMWADGGVARDLSFILWPLPVLLAAGAWLLFPWARRAKRAAEGQCRRCSHSLVGLDAPDGRVRCPECGAKNAAPALTRRDS